MSNVIPFAAGLLVAYRKIVAVGQIADLALDLQIQVFLETKQYEHPAWLTLVQTFERKLSEALREASKFDVELERIGDEWSHTVYVLLVALEDAQEIARALGKHASSIQPVEFIRDILEKTNASSSMILALAAQDAIAALRLAERFEIDLLTDLPAMIVLNSDQPAFWATILERAEQARGEGEIIAWTTIIAEAALYSSVVATWLLEVPTLMNLRIVARNCRPSERWFSPPGIPRTALTEILSVARKMVISKSMRERPLLTLFSRIRPPGDRFTVGGGADGRTVLLGVGIPVTGLINLGVVLWLGFDGAWVSVVVPLAIIEYGAIIFFILRRVFRAQLASDVIEFLITRRSAPSERLQMSSTVLFGRKYARAVGEFISGANNREIWSELSRARQLRLERRDSDVRLEV